MKKKIVILGSTGSIGTQTLEIARKNEELEIVSLAAGKNSKLLEKQIREFQPKYALLWEEKDASDLAVRLKDMDVKILYGMEGMLQMVTDEDVDIVLTALVGMIGIRPTIAAIESGKDIALANKETLVTAGHLIMPLARKHKVSILPVDSEHSAIFQSLNGEKKETVEKIILTASGGPFRGKTKDELQAIQISEALNHPNWSMGKKITIDSATLVNKGLEVMEAGWLFDVPSNQIEVVVHPQSIIHSMVQYRDGGIMAQLGCPDMKLPIQYALFYPDRKPMDGKRVDFFALKEMTFEKPDRQTFPGLALAYQAFEDGESMPTVFNAANEKCVELFLNKKIKFLEISEIIEKCMQHHHMITNPKLEEILEVEQDTYDYIRKQKEI
jgi:1-deoxy-D-xylulose-5-phosphate reductoisomerase